MMKRKKDGKGKERGKWKEGVNGREDGKEKGKGEYKRGFAIVN